MKTILITGHTGFIGGHLIDNLVNQGVKPIGVSRKSQNNVQIKEENCDLSTVKSFAFLDHYSIDGIIHLAANATIPACEMNPRASKKLNVDASIALAKYAQTKDIPFVFASTDQVFDGGIGNYTSKDIPNPINEYGKQKRAAEIALLRLKAKTIICRLPLVLGDNGGYEKTFVENLKAGKHQTLFTDEVRSAEQVSVIAQKLWLSLTWDSGIYHLGGPVALNRFEIGVQIANKHQLPIHLLQKGVQADMNLQVARPKNVSLQ